MTDTLHPPATPALLARRRALAPDQQRAFEAFGAAVFAPGALSARTKQIVAVAVAHATQCPWCIRSHTRAALAQGATEAELMEAIWVAAEMRTGGAYAHSAVAIQAMDERASAGGPAR